MMIHPSKQPRAILCSLLESPVCARDERDQANWQFLGHNGFTPKTVCPLLTSRFRSTSGLKEK